MFNYCLILTLNQEVCLGSNKIYHQMDKKIYIRYDQMAKNWNYNRVNTISKVIYITYLITNTEW
jgi:hypothetical protein